MIARDGHPLKEGPFAVTCNAFVDDVVDAALEAERLLKPGHLGELRQRFLFVARAALPTRRQGALAEMAVPSITWVTGPKA